MKKYVLAVAVFLGLAVGAFAETKPQQSRVIYPPDPGMFMTEAVYISTQACSDNSTAGSAVVISTRPVLIFGVNITTPSAAGTTLQIFDSKTTTTAVRAVTPPMTGATVMHYPWNVGTSSGATVRAAGGFCWGMSYMER